MQIGRCIFVWQVAVGAQTLSNRQGSSHTSIKHTSVSIQSASDWQGSGFLGVPGGSIVRCC